MRFGELPHFGTVPIPLFPLKAFERLLAAEELRHVQTFLIIFLTWVTPGVLLFAYLLWISKRVRRPNNDAPTVHLRGPLPDETETRARK